MCRRESMWTPIFVAHILSQQIYFLLQINLVCVNMDESFSPLVGYFSTPQPVSVEVGKAVHNDGNWKDNSEGTKHCTEPTNELSHSWHRCDITLKGENKLRLKKYKSLNYYYHIQQWWWWVDPTRKSQHRTNSVLLFQQSRQEMRMSTLPQWLASPTIPALCGPVSRCRRGTASQQSDGQAWRHEESWSK